jgi:hypothetical protein
LIELLSLRFALACAFLLRAARLIVLLHCVLADAVSMPFFGRRVRECF